MFNNAKRCLWFATDLPQNTKQRTITNPSYNSGNPVILPKNKSRLLMGELQ